MRNTLQCEAECACSAWAWNTELTGAGQHVERVVRLALLVGGAAHLQHGCSRHTVGLEAALRDGLA
jgi:hypothetical protein